MSTLVLGLGNPLLCDDGVGLEVARRVRAALAGRGDVRVEEACAGGLAVAERLVGYDRAVLVDAAAPGAGRPGALREVPLSPEAGSWNTGGPHDADLATALRTLALLGARVPARVHLLAIEAQDLATFAERLTPEVAAAVPAAVARVLSLVGEGGCP